MNKTNKKGIALSLAATIIITAISFGILFLILIRSGLLDNLMTIICTTMMGGISFIRGVTVDLFWKIYWVILGIVALVMATSRFCWTFPVGTAACAAMLAMITAILAIYIAVVIGGIPFFECPNPAINMGVKSDCGNGVEYTVFLEEAAARSFDCWSMYAKGRYDPLAGKTPPNPRTCFVINFNLNESIDYQQIKDWMDDQNYTQYVKIDIPLPGIDVWEEYIPLSRFVIVGNNSDDDPWAGEMIKGRLFIKYGDDYTMSHWYSPDCDIKWGYEGHGDRIYWCFDKSVTCATCGSGGSGTYTLGGATGCPTG